MNRNNLRPRRWMWILGLSCLFGGLTACDPYSKQQTSLTRTGTFRNHKTKHTGVHAKHHRKNHSQTGLQWPHEQGQTEGTPESYSGDSGNNSYSSVTPDTLENMPGTHRVYRRENLVDMFSRYGSQVMNWGKFFMQRAQYLQQRCQQPHAPRKECEVFRRSQYVFSINYAARPSLYRGYVALDKRRKHRIPRHVMQWYNDMWKSKYKKQTGRCFLEHGFASNCMAFAMCSQKDALSRFHGHWGQGFDTPTWGNINYWSTEAFYRLYYDYNSGGQRRPGVRTVFNNFAKWTPQKRKQISRQLLMDMLYEFNKINHRKSGHWGRMLYEKSFCSNIVVDMNRYDRGLPGDMFAQAQLRKTSRYARTSLHYMHWGLVVDSLSGKILHNQTPGGMWNRHFDRWGIQYDSYPMSQLSSAWKYNAKQRRFQQKVFFLNRPNVHYYAFARQQRADIYDTNHRSLCRDWISQHADVYFANLIPSYAPTPSGKPSPYISIVPSPDTILPSLTNVALFSE